MDHKQSPSIDEIQLVLGRTGVEEYVTKETTYNYVGGNVEDWVPKIIDRIKRVDHGNDHLVRKVISVWTEPNVQLLIFAITNRITGKNITVNGHEIRTLAAYEALARQFLSAQIGMHICDSQMRQSFLVANIDGGEIIDYKQCQEKKQQLQHKERLLNYAQKVKQRRSSIKRDFTMLGQYPELESYRDILQKELQSQDYFEQQDMQHIDSLEVELRQANERYTPNSILIRQQAKQLREERRKRIEAEQITERIRVEQEYSERQVEKQKKALEALYERKRLREEQEHKAQDGKENLDREQKLQPSATTSGGGCVLFVIAFGIGTVLLSNFSMLLLQLAALFLHRLF